ETAMQEMLSAVVLGNIPELNLLDRERLSALLTVHDWLTGILPDNEMPSRAEVAAAFVREDTLAPYRRLVSHGFVGRTRELKELQKFVEMRGFNEQNPGPIIIFGIGGIGKSTLIAKFLLDALTEDSEQKLLVGHLDMDDPTLDPLQPHTLLVELARQIGI